MKIFPLIILIYSCILFSSCSGCRRIMSEEQRIVWQTKYKKTQETVKAWVLKYSKFPKTYIPVSFSEFITMECEDSNVVNCNTYSIKHKYKLLNNDSMLIEKDQYFQLDNYNYIRTTDNPDAITEVSLEGFYNDPWIKEFGRQFSREDSIYFSSNPILKSHMDIELLESITDKGFIDSSDNKKLIELVEENTKMK